MWSVYSDDDPGRPAEPNENATPGTAPLPPAGLDPVELVVGGERFVVTGRSGTPGTYDFDWVSHRESYGFSVGANADWRPDRNEMAEEIRSFLSQIDEDTGYLPD